MSVWQRVSRLVVNLRLRTKFLLILFLAMAAVCACTLVTLDIPNAAYDEQLHQSSTHMIALFADMIQNELDDVEALSYRILGDNSLQDNLTIMRKKPLGSFAWTEAKKNVSERIANHMTWFNSGICLQLKTMDGQSFNQFVRTVHLADELTPERIALAHQGAGRAVWLVEEKDEPRLFLVREIREIKDLTLLPLATMLVEVDIPNVAEKYRRNVNRMGTAFTCAIYSGDVCLYASDDQVSSLPEGDDGYEFMTLNGEDCLCVRYTGQNGWRYVSLVDYSAINDRIRAANRLTMGIIAAVTLAALLVGAWLMTSVLRHLKILLEKFDAFALTGKPIPESDERYRTRRDEIGKLHRHFDKMTRDWDRVSRDNAEKQRILQEKQMQQLRAQVRPHFLYNTLESIYCLAKNAKDERIATMTDALGKMLRASLNDKRDIITVGEDLQTTRDYLRIQLVRYGEHLRVCYDVADELLACRIPAMTIQPLVENAVHHAAEEMLETCVIRISAEKVDGGVDVTVEDNGPGIDEDILAKLESGEIKPEGLGIGMRNIHKRVQYAFSDRYGLTVRSEPHRTRIIIHLPDTCPQDERQAMK